MKFFNKIYRVTFRFLTRKVIFKFYYWLCSRKPIKEDKVTFLELRLPQLSNNYQLLHKELTTKYDLDVNVHYIRQGFARGTDKYKRIFAFLKDAATSKYLILNEGSDISGGLKKREGQHIMNTWHGCGAFKKFGRSTADKIFGDTAKNAERYPAHPEYDLVTVSSPEVAWAYVEAMGKEANPDCIKPLGLSRTDVFYDPEFIANAKENVLKTVPASKGKKILLYAPTFRGRTKGAFSPSELDIKKFYDNFHDDYVLLFKHHPITHERPQIPAEYSDFAFDVTDSLSIEDLICASDICISDYSSLIFEYSLFEKPMIFFAFDLDEYFDWRGFYYDYDELTPGPVVSTNEEMIDYIKHVDERFDKEKVHEFKKKFMASCDGNATYKVIREFFGTEISKYRKSSGKVEVSVVVPSYNTEEFIDTCLSSIANQTFKDIEVIVVDDGSTDNTVKKINKFVKKDNRFRLIEQEHSNAGEARNKGLREAKGKYIVFWDSDDFFEPQAIEDLYDRAEAKKADIVICRHCKYDTKSGMKMYVQSSIAFLPEEEVFSRHEIPERIINVTTNVPWNKFFRVDFVRENGIEFQSIEKANDAFFSMSCMAFAERVCFLDEYLVNWRTGQSISTTTDPKRSPLCVFKAFEKTKDFLVSRGIYDEVKRSFINKALGSYLYTVSTFVGQQNINNFKTAFNYFKDEAFQKLEAPEDMKACIYREEKYELYKSIKEGDMVPIFMKMLTDSQARAEKINSKLLTRKENVDKKYDRMKNSFAYKVGMKVTWLPRTINAKLHGTKE
ncbi:CDP-glycerol glycerophosphotransferase family protein [Butyrivibrio sp. AE3004]|uniref:CDP-glycerol glycerophosphotransferase family protein n=1 Tax=Butyrivibrio sp. AE3004 TaxID=1506994 RepID=UPI00068C715A|nr:CDP-glycerol glycerophosphotransferase family protein [Butyrivibrio sp. AE3004]